MIFWRNKLFITPPKTGSTSLHNRLCGEDSGIYIMGPQWGGKTFIEKHTVAFPYAAISSESEVIVIVRSPFDRALSLYAHHKKYEGEGDFEWFVRRILLTGIDGFLSTTISRILVDVKYDNYIKLEHIEQVFKDRWDVELSLPRLNSGEHGGREEYTEGIADLVRLWGYWDFQNFKYDEEL